MKNLIKLFALGAALAVLFLFGSIGAAAPTDSAGKPNTNDADEELVTVILDDFEKAGTWIPDMPRDQGVIFSMQREGSPEAIKALVAKISNDNVNYLKTKEQQKMLPKENPLVSSYAAGKYVLGARIEFMRRGYNWYTLRPPLPIKVPGICKSIAVWVVGRGFNHKLVLKLRDYNGGLRYIEAMRPLTHRGWARILFPIPPNIAQEDFKVTDPKHVGLTFEGFIVNCDPMESIGKQFIYFDLLTAQVNLYFEFAKDKDDMPDFW